MVGDEEARHGVSVTMVEMLIFILDTTTTASFDDTKLLFCRGSAERENILQCPAIDQSCVVLN